MISIASNQKHDFHLLRSLTGFLSLIYSVPYFTCHNIWFLFHCPGCQAFFFSSTIPIHAYTADFHTCYSFVPLILIFIFLFVMYSTQFCILYQDLWKNSSYLVLEKNYYHIRALREFHWEAMFSWVIDIFIFNPLLYKERKREKKIYFIIIPFYEIIMYYYMTNYSQKFHTKF